MFGLQWQGAPSKDVLGKYRVWIPGGTTLDQCACLYARVRLVAHHWWVGNRCESKKKSYVKYITLPFLFYLRYCHDLSPPFPRASQSRGQMIHANISKVELHSMFQKFNSGSFNKIFGMVFWKIIVESPWCRRKHRRY